MSRSFDYAPEYSKKEKVLRLFIFLVVAGTSIALQQAYLPNLQKLIEHLPCYHWHQYNGLQLMWFTLFVGIPLSGALIFTVIFLPIAFKTITDGQFPPQGYKVYKKTKIVRGMNAKLRAYCLLVVPILFIMLSIWGGLQLHRLPQQIPSNFDYSVCEKT